MFRSRLASLVLAVAIGAGWLVGAAHTLLVAHAVCAEHGESVHVASATGDSAAAADAFTAGGRDEDSHEHCSIATCAPRVDAPARGHAIAWVARGIAPLAGTGVVLEPSIPLFRLAPKCSPPVTG